jgi:LmbE family N-acetylglucosaminyl deacetylase
MRILPATLLLAVLAAVPVPARSVTGPLPAALEPVSTGGIETVDRALAKLSTHQRVLLIGAHPDDEYNPLMAVVARDFGGEAAYLSLSRGEGGQNLLGPELGVGLGLIRTGELESARRIEGSRQYFTRAFDFGYTRSLEETFERWPREVLQEDSVRVIRRFRPQVVMAIFPADARARHGQHWAAGVIAGEVFELAGNPDRFPQLTASGSPPWRPGAFYRAAWWNRDLATVEIPLGGIDPFSGKSMAQIAAASRSMHRSQDMGRTQRIGPAQAYLIWEAGGAGAEGKDLFAGVDTSLKAIAGRLDEGEAKGEAQVHLDAVESLAKETRAELSPSRLEAALPALAAIHGHLTAALAAVAGSSPEAEVVSATELIEEKRRVTVAAMAAAAGIAMEAVSSRETVALGEQAEVTVGVWNSSNRPLEVGGVGVESPDGWSVSLTKETPGRLEAGALAEWTFEATVPADAAPTQPYFLLQPLVGDLYDWSSAEPAVRGEPLQAPPLVAVGELTLEGVPIRLVREVVYRYADQARGEVRRPVRAVPLLEVAVEPALVVWPIQAETSPTIEVTLTSNTDRRLSGELEVELPPGWPEPIRLPFAIDEPQGREVIQVALPDAEALQPGAHSLAVRAVLDDGGSFDMSYAVVDYPHVRPSWLPTPARTEIRALDLRLPGLDRVGYIRGAADRVPDFLREVGVPVELLEVGELANGELSTYDAIVVGPRAYEKEPALARINTKLLEYVRSGGLLIVQYQQYQFVEGGFAPYPLEIARPHGRVTDETSPVRVLFPDHAVFLTPNAIDTDDWLGWVQERGLYFASTWDEAYTPLLVLQDPDQPEQQGALLVATLGEGSYVYTGLSFFRELPAGVAGAYRLLANLLALGE